MFYNIVFQHFYRKNHLLYSHFLRYIDETAIEELIAAR